MNTTFIPGKMGSHQSPLFDSLAVATTTALGTKKTFFETPAGGSKGVELTNMESAFELPAGKFFRFFGMAIVAIACAKADIESAMKNYRFTLFYAGVPRLEGGMEYFPGGGGPWGVTNETGGLLYTNGVPDPRAVNQLDPEYSFTIEPKVPFRVEMEGTTFTTTAAFFLRVYLLGIRENAISGSV